MRGFELGKPERLAIEFEAMTQHMQRTLKIQLLGKGSDDL